MSLGPGGTHDQREWSVLRVVAEYREDSARNSEHHAASSSQTEGRLSCRIQQKL